MIELTETEKEINFLKSCGMNLKYGYWSCDLDYWKKKEPELYKKYVKDW